MSNAERLASILKKLGDAHYQAADELIALATEQPQSAPAVRAEAAAIPSAAAPPAFDDLPPMGEPAPKSRDALFAECPDHQKAWEPRPGGVSKNGRAYPAFWSCSGKAPDGSYCKKKPDPSWARAHDPEQALLQVPF